MLITRVSLWTLLLTTLMAYSVSGADFKIASGGKPGAAILLDGSATVPEQNAARELAAYLKKVTGANIDIYTPGSQPKNLSRIHVGQSDEAKKLLGDIDWNTLKFDGIVIKFNGKDLILAGDRPRGTVYAVYSFLQDYVGCNWWTAKASSIPYKPNLSVNVKDVQHISPYLYRETFYAPVNRKNTDFSVKLKLNGDHQPVPAEFGDHYKILGFVHTFDRFIPEREYFSKHPEWFSMVDGKRVGGQLEGQLCLTNEEMKAELIKNALSVINEDPVAGMISISQNDNFHFCQCDKCTAVADEEGGQSGLLIRFVNDVADAINEKYPDFLIETLAYQYTRHAPKLAKPRDSVVVRLCSIECDFSKPLDFKTNETFYKDLVDWGKISKRLFIWDYVVNFGNLLVAHPNWKVIAPNIRIFADNKVVGLFEQGDGYNNDASFAHMKIWVMSQLMWDPSLNQRELMNKFAAGYYGAAGKYLIMYLDLISDAIDKSGKTLGCFNGNRMDYMTEQDMYSASNLFDKAEKAVINEPELLERVRIERQALDHMWLRQIRCDRTDAGKSRGMSINEIAEYYIQQAELTGNNFIGEGITMSADYLKQLRDLAKAQPLPPARVPADVPAAAKGKEMDEWFDIQEDKMNLHMLDILSKVVADPTASDGRAAWLPGSTNEWGIMTYVKTAENKIEGEIDLHVSIKVQAKAQQGHAYTIGIYDVKNKKSILSKVVRIEDLQNNQGYIDYNLGTYTPAPEWYVYVAPPGDGELIEGVFVDRFYVVKTD